MSIRTAIRKLFVARASTVTAPPSGEAARAGELEAPLEPPQPAAPVFITLQSLSSFAGASLVINLLWHLVAVIDENLARKRFVPIALGFFIGTVIYLISLDKAMSRKDKIIGALVAFLNAAWLGLNALGIDIIKPPT